ncbi:NAD-dependent epimerase/dehydratase family protein, partial [Klebsiella pneumoniae]
MAEQALQFFARTEGLDFRILRVSNPVGRFARSTTQGLVSVAMNAIISGRPITLFGDGSNVRDLVDADDVADALIMS